MWFSLDDVFTGITKQKIAYLALVQLTYPNVRNLCWMVWYYCHKILWFIWLNFLSQRELYELLAHNGMRTYHYESDKENIRVVTPLKTSPIWVRYCRRVTNGVPCMCWIYNWWKLLQVCGLLLKKMRWYLYLISQFFLKNNRHFYNHRIRIVDVGLFCIKYSNFKPFFSLISKNTQISTACFQFWPL